MASDPGGSNNLEDLRFPYDTPPVRYKKKSRFITSNSQVYNTGDLNIFDDGNTKGLTHGDLDKADDRDVKRLVSDNCDQTDRGWTKGSKVPQIAPLRRHQRNIKSDNVDPFEDLPQFEDDRKDSSKMNKVEDGPRVETSDVTRKGSLKIMTSLEYDSLEGCTKIRGGEEGEDVGEERTKYVGEEDIEDVGQEETEETEDVGEEEVDLEGREGHDTSMENLTDDAEKIEIFKNGEPHIVYADGTEASGDGGETDGGAGEGEEEEEPEPPVMSKEEKKTMYDAVCEGDIDLLDDLLDLPGADINMEWFGENLLMAAIRSAESDMAAFLIDNGINRNFEAMRLEMKNPNTRQMALYPISCRQMAKEHDMDDVVDVIDELNNNIWPFIKRAPRTVRIKRPLEDKLREKHEAAEAERRRRYEMELMYRRKNSPEEVEEEEEEAKDNASITSKTSYGSSFAFSDMTSVRGERRNRPSRGGADSDGETLGDVMEQPEEGKKLGDGVLGPDDIVEGDEEEDEGPFYVPLGPTHMFPYPAEEKQRIIENTHMYRSNKAFISRRCTNSQRVQPSGQPTGSGRTTPSVGSYRDESKLWTPHNGMSSFDFTPAAARLDRHSSFTTRLMSPWKEDDDETISNLKRRSKSACTMADSLRKFKSGNFIGAGMRKPVQHRPFFPSLIKYQLPTRESYIPTSKSLQPHGLASRSDEAIITRPPTVAQNHAAPGSYLSRGSWLNKAVYPSAGLNTKDSDDFGGSTYGKSRMNTGLTRSYTSMTRRRGTDAMHLVSPT